MSDKNTTTETTQTTEKAIEPKAIFSKEDLKRALEAAPESIRNSEMYQAYVAASLTTTSMLVERLEQKVEASSKQDWSKLSTYKDSAFNSLIDTAIKFSIGAAVVWAFSRKESAVAGDAVTSDSGVNDPFSSTEKASSRPNLRTAAM